VINDKYISILDGFLLFDDVAQGDILISKTYKLVNMFFVSEEAVFLGISAAFNSGVNQVHITWLIRGKNQAVQDFIEISDPLAGGDLSVNSADYPADT
jgi:hypothetical protein